MSPCRGATPMATSWRTERHEGGEARSPGSGSPTSAGWASAPSPPGCWPTSAPRSSRSRTAPGSTRRAGCRSTRTSRPANFGEEDIDPDPNKGGLFNNYCRNKLGVTINMRTAGGQELAERLIASQQRRHRELRPGRDGAVGPDLRAAPRAVARRDLRPHERLRPHRPARRVPQLRPGRPGRERAVLHQRPARAGAVGLGPVVHGQPGRLLQLGRPC